MNKQQKKEAKANNSNIAGELRRQIQARDPAYNMTRIKKFPVKKLDLILTGLVDENLRTESKR